MKRSVRHLLAALLLLPLSMCQPAFSSDDVYHDAVIVDEVVSVYDGDTVKVNIHSWPAVIGQEISIRIRGIDTPEIRGEECQEEEDLGYKARDLVAALASDAQRVEIRQLGRDKYFRLLGELWIDNQSVGALLIEQGLAREYYGGTKTGWCLDW